MLLQLFVSLLLVVHVGNIGSFHVLVLVFHLFCKLCHFPVLLLELVVQGLHCHGIRERHWYHVHAMRQPKVLKWCLLAYQRLLFLLCLVRFARQILGFLIWLQD